MERCFYIYVSKEFRNLKFKKISIKNKGPAFIRNIIVHTIALCSCIALHLGCPNEILWVNLQIEIC